MGRESKKGKRTINWKKIITRVAVGLFALYVVVSFVNLNLTLSDRRRVLEEARSQYQELDIINKELNRMLQSGSDADYARRVAREKLGLAYADERVYKYQ